MGNFTVNDSKGSVAELARRVNANDPAASAFVLVLLKAAEADAVLKDYDDLGALLAAAGNTEADFTNYGRKTLTDADGITVTVDDTNERIEVDIPDQTYTAAGGAVNNTLTDLVTAYDSDTGAGTDANIRAMTVHDFAATTDGNDLTATIAVGGFFQGTD